MARYICSYHKKQKNPPSLTCRGYLLSIVDISRELLKTESSDKHEISQECDSQKVPIDQNRRFHSLAGDNYLLSLYIRSAEHNST